MILSYTYSATLLRGIRIMAITTVQDLRAHLQWAIQVELTTIPTYLYAMYSIKEGGSEAAAVFKGVVVEEMLHVGPGVEPARGGRRATSILPQGHFPQLSGPRAPP